MDFDPLKPPRPSYYNEWQAERIKRTLKACQTQDVIQGTQIRNELLSLSTILEQGFKLNTRFDRMEKQDTNGK